MAGLLGFCYLFVTSCTAPFLLIWQFQGHFMQSSRSPSISSVSPGNVPLGLMGAHSSAAAHLHGLASPCAHWLWKTYKQNNTSSPPKKSHNGSPFPEHVGKINSKSCLNAGREEVGEWLCRRRRHCVPQWWLTSLCSQLEHLCAMLLAGWREGEVWVPC